MIAIENQLGWVRLHREWMNSPLWANDALWKLLCYCLLRAAHTSRWVTITTGLGTTEVHLQPGQFIFGRFQAARDLHAKPDATYKRLRKLEKYGFCHTRSTNKYTVVTVLRWADLQGNASGGNSQSTREVTGKYQGSNTNKNGKNDKNVESRAHTQNPGGFQPPSPEAVKQYAESIGYPEIDAEHFCTYYTANGWKRADGTPIHNWKQAVVSWKKRERQSDAPDATPIHEPKAPTPEQLAIIEGNNS